MPGLRGHRRRDQNVKRYSDDQIDQAMLLAMERHAALELDEDRRAMKLARVEDARAQMGQIPPDALTIESRSMMRLFLEAILQDKPARPGTPAERQQRIADRIEARKAKRRSKGRPS